MTNVEGINENSPNRRRHPLTEFGIYVQDRCHRMEMTQIDLARGLNIAPASLSRVLRGQRQPSQRLELAVRHLLGVPSNLETDQRPADTMLLSNNQLRESLLNLEERVVGLETKIDRIVSILETHFRQ